MNRGTTREWRDLVFAVAALVLVVALAAIIHPNRVPGWEEAIFHPINSLPGSLYWPLWVVMQVGNLLAAPAAALVAAVFRRFRLAAALASAGVAKLYASRLVKDLVTRERPASVIDDVTRRGDASATGEAFVSGHAVIAFALATLAAPYLSRRGRLVIWCVAVAVCVGRVYVGAHLPLDVVAGGALGWGIGSALNFLFGVPSRIEGPGASSGMDPEDG